MSAICTPQQDILDQEGDPIASDGDWGSHPPGPLPFERRMADRWPMQGKATAICVAGETFGEIYDLRMLDYSHEGMGAMCEKPISPGMLITVGFQQPGHPARRGTVSRCQPWGDGYRIGVVFQMRLAA